MISGADSVSRQNKIDCEDAYFISEKAFGVSDGVSGWNQYGFSSKDFSQ